MDINFDEKELKRITDTCLNQKAVKKEMEDHSYDFLAGIAMISMSDKTEDVNKVIENIGKLSPEDRFTFSSYLLATCDVCHEIVEKYGLCKKEDKKNE